MSTQADTQNSPRWNSVVLQFSFDWSTVIKMELPKLFIVFISQQLLIPRPAKAAEGDNICPGSHIEWSWVTRLNADKRTLLWKSGWKRAISKSFSLTSASKYPTSAAKN